MTHRGSGRKSFGLAQEPSGKRASMSVALIDWSHTAGRTHFQDACWSLSLEAELVTLETSSCTTPLSTLAAAPGWAASAGRLAVLGGDGEPGRAGRHQSAFRPGLLPAHELVE
jgi:hypothetical protein